jgi:transcriptional regulator with XRE-family HTH domain
LATLKEVIARKISYFRALKEISQEELAARAGISKQTVFMYESGEADNITSKTITVLAKALEIDEDLLFHPGFPPKPLEHSPQDCYLNVMKTLKDMPARKSKAFALALLDALKKD